MILFMDGTIRQIWRSDQDRIGAHCNSHSNGGRTIIHRLYLYMHRGHYLEPTNLLQLLVLLRRTLF